MKKGSKKKKTTDCWGRIAQAKEDLSKLTKKETEPKTPKQFFYVEDGKRHIAPCETCLYLIPDNVCMFPTCIRLNGWKGQRDEREEESAEGVAGES